FMCPVLDLHKLLLLSGKAMIEDTDMPSKMQIQAMAYASEALDLFDVLVCKSIAAHI
ncbi:dynein light chain LC6 flagellar outer arm-like, partial [Trifolium medium]|nr:dynein light chain LC6 flagellar outer arm-like [Trifolium medium]